MIEIERLEQLKRLRETGALTEDEFVREKAAILARGPDPQSRSQSRTFLLTVVLASIVGIALAIYVWAAPGTNTLTDHPPQQVASGDEGEMPSPRTSRAAEISRIDGNPDAAQSSLARGTGKLISGCYHLDRCGYSKVIKTRTVDRKGDDRLVTAVIQRGEVPNARGDASDEKRIAWFKELETVYALCSRTRPTLIQHSASKFRAEEFDFGGDLSVPGQQQNDADLYHGLCDQFFGDARNEHDPASRYRHIEHPRDYEIDRPQDVFRSEMGE